MPQGTIIGRLYLLVRNSNIVDSPVTSASNALSPGSWSPLVRLEINFESNFAHYFEKLKDTNRDTNPQASFESS